jgi:23S rRNA (guanosine2251-2'-O)-methyltransferase
MIKKENDLRIGFHSIESIINHNPHKIKKVLLPASRDDLRINELMISMDKNNIKYEVSNKLKQEPEAMIANDPELNFKDLKNYLISH